VYDPPLHQGPRAGRNHRPALRREFAGPFYLGHAVEVLGLPALQLANLEVYVQVEEIMRIISAAVRPWANSSMCSASKPRFSAQTRYVRTTTAVESTRTPFRSKRTASHARLLLGHLSLHPSWPVTERFAGCSPEEAFGPALPRTPIG
jgi:hypothetical protein